MPQFEEFDAWITIDGERAEEYEVTNSADQKTKFSVNCRVPSLPSDVAGSVKMDGIACAAVRWHDQGGYCPGPHYKKNWNQRRHNTEAVYVLVLENDDTFLSSSAHQELGRIELTIYPIVILGTTVIPLTSLAQATVHERSKKAVTQQIGVAEPELVAEPTVPVNAMRAGPNFVTFSFQYCPLAFLKFACRDAPREKDCTLPAQLKRKVPADQEPPRAQTPAESEACKKPRCSELKVLDAKIQNREKKPRVKNEGADDGRPKQESQVGGGTAVYPGGNYRLDIAVALAEESLQSANLAKDFNAWITIDGEPAEEYDVETSEDQKTVTCWIASQLGKKFSVHCRVPPLPTCVAGYVKMDGVRCGSTVLRPGYHDRVLVKRGITDGTILKPFMFSSLQVTDDDTFLSSSSNQELGCIELAVAPVDIIGTTLFPLPSLDQATIHERSKKAVTQQITTAETELVAVPAATLSLRYASPDFVTFSFKYRPLDLLRANGIAPSPPRLKRKASAEPEPPRAQTPDSEDLADLQEAEALREKLKALEAKLNKREKKPRVKDEGGGEVIDLTRDSARGARSRRVKLEGKRPTQCSGCARYSDVVRSAELRRGQTPDDDVGDAEEEMDLYNKLWKSQNRLRAVVAKVKTRQKGKKLFHASHERLCIN
ncbi:hypothetical protein DFH06DRAFT_1290564 [Mycena polygramma]|nr:hypothetical protein DFH06DRAFT_1290564 [Mycena polygramma]